MAGGEASADVFAAVMLASSPLFTFFGARLFKPVIGVIGFLFSAIGLQLLLERAGVWDGMAPASAMTTVFLAGLAGTILVLSLYSFGVFVLGGTVFILLTNLMFQLTATKFGSGGERGEITRLALSGAVFVAAGVLTLQVWKHVLRILTAFVGGYLFVAGVDHLGVRWNAWSDDSLCAIDALFRSPYTFRCNSPECFAFLGVWGGLFLIGVLYQNRHKDSEPHEVRPPRTLTPVSSSSAGFGAGATSHAIATEASPLVSSVSPYVHASLIPASNREL